MEQIGSEYNFRTGGAIKELNDVIVRVEQLEKALKKTEGTSKGAGDGVQGAGEKAKKAKTNFDALGNSINQVTREFPAFAFSAQTGFLAVSNNIPILLDSINELKRANADLAAQGKATVPVFKQVIASLFSWQTAISLLISFTVLYSKEIASFIANVFKGKASIDSLKISVDALNRAYDSKELKNGIESIIELKNQIALAKTGYINKEAVLKSYNEQFGRVLGTTNDINIAEQKLIDGTPTLIKALANRAAAASLVSDAAQTIIDIQKKQQEVDDIEANRNQSLFQQFRDGVAIGQQITDKGVEEAKKKRLNAAKNELNDLKLKLKSELDVSAKFSNDAEKILGGVGKGSGEALKSAFQILQEELAKTEDAFKSAKLKGVDTSEIEAKFKSLQKQLEMVKNEFDELTGEADKRRVKEFTETLEQALDDIENESRRVSEIADKDLKDRIDQRNKEIKDGVLAIEEEYASMKESRVLSTKEELELERGKQLAIISYLTEVGFMDEKIQKEIIERRIKLKEITSNINREQQSEDLKATKENLEEELLANREFFIDLRDEKQRSKKELTQIDISELESRISILKEYQKAGADVQKQILDAERAIQRLKVKLNKDANDEELEDDKEKARQKRAILMAATELGSTISNGYFDLRKSQLEEETSIQIEELDKQKENRIITEEQYNAKRKQILNDQAEKQRELNLSEIKVQTALAIIRAFATGLTPFDRILAATLAAAQGAAQYAFASAQPLPRFAKGTDRVVGGVKGKDSVHALLMPDEAVIPAKENLARPNLAKAWINGNLDSFLMMNYIKPAIEENNKKWEAVLKVNQNSTFIRNDNFNDKRIVGKLDKIGRALSNQKQNVVVRGKGRLWNLG